MKTTILIAALGGLLLNGGQAEAQFTCPDGMIWAPWDGCMVDPGEPQGWLECPDGMVPAPWDGCMDDPGEPQGSFECPEGMIPAPWDGCMDDPGEPHDPFTCPDGMVWAPWDGCIPEGDLPSPGDDDPCIYCDDELPGDDHAAQCAALGIPLELCDIWGVDPGDGGANGHGDPSGGNGQDDGGGNVTCVIDPETNMCTNEDGPAGGNPTGGAGEPGGGGSGTTCNGEERPVCPTSCSCGEYGWVCSSDMMNCQDDTEDDDSEGGIQCGPDEIPVTDDDGNVLGCLTTDKSYDDSGNDDTAYDDSGNNGGGSCVVHSDENGSWQVCDSGYDDSGYDDSGNNGGGCVTHADGNGGFWHICP